MVQNAKRRFERTPLTENEKKIYGDVDYATGLTLAKNAINQLNELVPDGNADLTEVEFGKLLTGVNELGKFLRARGCVLPFLRTDEEVAKLVSDSVAVALIGLATEVKPLIEVSDAGEPVHGLVLDQARAAVSAVLEPKTEEVETQ